MCSCSAWAQCWINVKNFAFIWSNIRIRIFKITVEFKNMIDLTLTFLLLIGSEKQTFDVITKTLNLMIQFLKDSSLFDDPLITMSTLDTFWCISLSWFYDHLISDFSFFFPLLLTPYKFQKEWCTIMLAFDFCNHNSFQYQCLTVMGTVFCIDENYFMFLLFCFNTVLFATAGL